MEICFGIICGRYFGGAASYNQALQLKTEIIRTGYVTTARANLDKCHGPSQRLQILGIIYDASTKTCSLPQKEVNKYIGRINTIL